MEELRPAQLHKKVDAILTHVSVLPALGYVVG